jgi:hypothetical protein
MASLVAVAGCNQQLYTLVDRADHLWEPFLAEIKFHQTGFIDDTDWISPNIPSSPADSDYDVVVCEDLRVPPRINGGIRDYYSFFIHPRDEEARGRGLVLARLPAEPWSEPRRRTSMFDRTTGILKDLFRYEHGGWGCSFPGRYRLNAKLVE